MNAKPLIVSYGIGVDSTAILVGLAQRGLVPAHILFADTGGEKPETYAYLPVIAAWLAQQGFPPVTPVFANNRHKTLEQEVRSRETLPAMAFGVRSCSDKWKVQPQKKYLRGVYGDLSGLRFAIGYDATETKRAAKGMAHQEKFERWFPLIEWGWDRARCMAEIEGAGLPVPVKSACWFCPCMKKPEVIALAEAHPDLMSRARQMEAGATRAHTIKGLGRSYSWTALVEKEAA